MRWAVLKRRYECAESTLRTDLNGLRYVYIWGEASFAEGLEARLESRPLEYDEILRLRNFLEAPDAAVVGRLGDEAEVSVPAPSSVGARSLS